MMRTYLINKKYSILLIAVLISLSILSYFLCTHIIEKNTNKAGNYINNRTRIPASLQPTTYTMYNPRVKAESKQMMDTAKKLYAIEDYEGSNTILSKLLTQYPYAINQEEALFLLADGLFKTNQLKESERIIAKLQLNMMEPYSDWVGRALLLLAHIYIETKDIDKATQLYHRVILNFTHNEALVTESEMQLMNIEL